jgi:aspartyl-tRNA synthetase
MDFQERMMASVLASVAAEHGEAIRTAFGVEVTVPAVPFPRVTMAEARSVADGSGPRGDSGPRPRGDLDPAGERAVGAYAREAFGHEFVFVTAYPADARPFYHMRPVGSPELTCSYDLLWNGLEITTGAQREHRYDVLLRQLASKGIAAEPMLAYLRCFQYGCPPHGGFGLGLSRLLMVLLGLSSIREATFLFRGPNRLTP